MPTCETKLLNILEHMSTIAARFFFNFNNPFDPQLGKRNFKAFPTY